MQNLVHFTQGTAFMFLLMASFYFIKKGADRLRLILGRVLLYGLFLHVVDFAFYGPRPNYIDDLVSIICITAIPACAFILYELINPNSVTWKMVLMHELPCFVLVSWYLIKLEEDVYYISLILAILYSIIFITVLFYSIPKYHNKIKEEYSFTENLEIKWLWSILSLFVVFLFIWIYSSFKDDNIARIVYYVGTSIIWTSVGYFVTKHQLALQITKELQLSSQINAPAEAEDADLENLKDPLLQYRFVEKLNYLFVKKKVFLNSKLTLGDVTLELTTNRTYLSDYLNRVLETTFYDYVNEFRLEYAAELMVKEPDLTLEQVSDKSGFNSLSTFRRSFTKRYSCTPHNYRKNPKILV